MTGPVEGFDRARDDERADRDQHVTDQLSADERLIAALSDGEAGELPRGQDGPTEDDGDR